MSALFGGTKTPPPPPTIEDPAVDEARREQLLAQRRRRGRASTILTGPGGLTGDTAVGIKTLLGQ